MLRYLCISFLVVSALISSVWGAIDLHPRLLQLAELTQRDSTNVVCGGDRPYSCKDAELGDYCSADEHCGLDKAHCGEDCQYELKRRVITTSSSTAKTTSSKKSTSSSKKSTITKSSSTAKTTSSKKSTTSTNSTKTSTKSSSTAKTTSSKKSTSSSKTTSTPKTASSSKPATSSKSTSSVKSTSSSKSTISSKSTTKSSTKSATSSTKATSSSKSMSIKSPSSSKSSSTAKTTSSSKSTTSSTKSTSKSSSASTSTHLTSSTSPVSPSSSSVSSATSFSSSTPTDAIATYSPTVCPQTSPSQPLAYGFNSSFSEQLNQTFSLYQSDNTSTVAFNIDNTTVYVDVSSDSSVSAFAPDGSGVTISDDGLCTFTAPGCDYAFDVNASSLAPPSSKLRRRSSAPSLEPRQAGGDLEVTISLTDQCGNPASGQSVSLECDSTSSLAAELKIPTDLLYFVYNEYEPMTDNGDGSYTGSCPLDGYQQANSQAFAECHGGSTNIINLCSNQPLNFGIAASGFPKLVALATNYLGTVGGTLLKGFSYTGTLCSAITAIGNNAVAGLDALACTSQAFSVAATATVQGTPLPLGTFNPVATTVQAATSVSNTDLSACTTTSSASPTATPNYAERTDNCTTSAGSPDNGNGNAVYCCSGGCIDGTYIGSAGQCNYWLDLCLDLQGGPPSCGSNQVLLPGPDGNGVDSGDGYCWGGGECSWQRNNWTWTCCDCPSGYISITDGACDPGDGSIANDPPSFPCLGCDEGTLAVNATGGYYCDLSSDTDF